MELTRRSLLALGCSAAASPLITPVALAAAPWDTRLVVIILRGGMDGLDVVQPYGDPDFSALRRTLSQGPSDGAIDLDGFFAMHQALADLAPMWRRGDLAFAHAVSTPYRDKRSHFDGQDMLEAGTEHVGGGVRDGWLNRLLQVVPGAAAETAYAIGLDSLPVLAGPAPVSNWSPQADLTISPQAMSLLELVSERDPALHAALAEAQMLDEDTGMQGASLQKQMNTIRQGAAGHIKIADFAAKRLRGAARIAAFSLNGWDTHRGQARGLSTALGRLSQTLLTLEAGLGPQVWGKTAVVAMTEFGRTARENGTRGTDHGTGGAMVMAGGAVRGGKVYGTWPGLAEADLFQRRDVMPTRDVRAFAGWIMRAATGLDASVLEGTVFPGMDLGTDPGLMP
ncbi:MAG: DUF1501 domain-containing protein [Pseudomonadota bacterium]